MFKKYQLLFLTLSFILSACATTYNPATEKQELILVTTPIEVMLGNNVAGKISQEFTFVKEQEPVDRTSKIGEKIANVSDRKDLKYHFAVIKDKEVNAFTTPGGYVYINSGLMDMVTDDELACVIGHEIGHVAARHIAKKLQAQLGYELLMNIAASRAGFADLQKAASITFDLISLGYSREDELLADRLGAKYAYKAGYDPYAMISFLKKLKDLDKGEIGIIFLRSHPYASQRIEMMNKHIKPIIEKADKEKQDKAIQTIQPQAQQTVVTEKQNSIVSEPVVLRKNQPTRIMCPKCKKIFAGTINYCPYDGTKL